MDAQHDESQSRTTPEELDDKVQRFMDELRHESPTFVVWPIFRRWRVWNDPPVLWVNSDVEDRFGTMVDALEARMWWADHKRSARMLWRWLGAKTNRIRQARAAAVLLQALIAADWERPPAETPTELDVDITPLVVQLVDPLIQAPTAPPRLRVALLAA